MTRKTPSFKPRLQETTVASICTVTKTALATIFAGLPLLFAPTSAAAASGSYAGCPVLNYGSRGSCVVRLQQDLNRAINANLAVDGVYGDRTRQATLVAQRQFGLTRDALVGARTAQTLTNVSQLGFPNLPPASNYPPTLNPANAAAWAMTSTRTFNSTVSDPCTDFTSQALSSGGLPENDVWYSPTNGFEMYIHGRNLSGPFVNVLQFKQYVVQKGWAREVPLDLNNPRSALMARPGDLIAVTWRGGGPHMVIVTGMTGDIALKSEQSGHSAFTNVDWYRSYSNGGRPISEVYASPHATLLHWNEQPQ